MNEAQSQKAPKKNARAKALKALVIAVLLLAVVAFSVVFGLQRSGSSAGALLSDTVLKIQDSPDGFSVTFTGNNIIKAEAMGRNIVVLREKFLTCIDRKGSVRFEQAMTFSEPRIYTGEKYGVLYDKLSSKYMVFDAKGILREGESENKKNIFLAKTKADGGVVLAAGGESSASMLYVLDKKGEKQFVWECSDEYIVDFDVTADGEKILCGTIGTRNGELYTGVYVLDIHSDEIYRQYQLTAENCVCVKYISDSKISVLTGGSLHVFRLSEENAVPNTVQFPSQALFYAADGNGNMAVVTESAAGVGQDRLTLYTGSGKEKYSVDIRDGIKELRLEGGAAYLLYEDTVRKISSVDEVQEYIFSVKSVGMLKCANSIYCYSLNTLEKAEK